MHLLVHTFGQITLISSYAAVGVYGINVMVIVSKQHCHVLHNSSVYAVRYMPLITYSIVT